jgi:hypothetical protein
VFSRNPPDRGGKWASPKNSAAGWGRTIWFCLIGIVIGPMFPGMLVVLALRGLDPKLATEAGRWLLYLGQPLNSISPAW